MVILSGSVSNYIFIGNRKYSYFGGNNYLGLANHPSLLENAINSIRKYGINFSASRQTTGTSELHLELENLLSEFKNKSGSVVYASGYMGNRILLNVLKDRYSAVFMDGSAHPSIHDAIPAGMTNVFSYDHCNPGHLEILLKEHKRFKPLIITDGIFALTGEIAPLDEIFQLAGKYNAILVTDDSHATGVLGKNGRGTPEHFNIDGSPNIYQSETLSKALGAYGGFISADSDLIASIRDKSGIYQASTSLPPPIAAAACSAVTIVMQQPELRTILNENIKVISEAVRNLDFLTYSRSTPIISVLFGSRANAEDLSEFLKTNNIIVPHITYPVKTNKFIVRITVSACHSKEQMQELIDCLIKWRKNHGSDKD